MHSFSDKLMTQKVNQPDPVFFTQCTFFNVLHNDLQNALHNGLHNTLLHLHTIPQPQYSPPFPLHPSHALPPPLRIFQLRLKPLISFELSEKIFLGPLSLVNALRLERRLRVAIRALEAGEGNTDFSLRTHTLT